MRLKLVVLAVITSLSIGPAFASSVLDEFIPQTILTEAKQSQKYQNPVTFIVSGIANGTPDAVATKLSTQPGSVGPGETRGAWQDCL